jgi:hypothetical protein
MRKSARGYQVLPRPVGDDAPTTRPMRAADDDDAAALQLLLAYRPALRDRLVALPPPDLASLPALLDALDRWKHKLQIAPIGPATTRTMAGGVISHESSDEELVISEIGRRIEQVLAHADPKEVEALLVRADRNGGINSSYGKIVIHRADAAGTGPVYYADAPVRTPIAFKRMRPF